MLTYQPRQREEEVQEELKLSPQKTSKKGSKDEAVSPDPRKKKLLGKERPDVVDAFNKQVSLKGEKPPKLGASPSMKKEDSEQQSETSKIVQNLYYRHMHEINNHNKYAGTLALKDTDPKCIDFSDVAKQSDLLMLDPQAMEDEKATFLLRKDA